MSIVVEILRWSHWLAALLLSGLFVYCLRHENRPAGRAIAVFCILAALWAFIAALIPHLPDLATKVLMNRVKMVAPVLLPLSLLATGFALYGKRRWQPAVWLLFAVTPVISLVLLATPAHVLLINGYDLIDIAGYEVLSFANGPWFIVHNLNARLAAALTIGLLVKRRIDLSVNHNIRFWLVIVAILVPFVGDTIAVTVYQNMRFMQLVPTLLLFSAFVLIYAVWRRHFVNVVPFARRNILDATDDLFLVFDADGVLVDFNRKAAEVLNMDRAWLGAFLADIRASHLSEEAKSTLSSMVVAVGTVWDHAGESYEVSERLIKDQSSGRIGTILSGKCITARKQSEDALADLVSLKTKLLAVMGHDFHGNLAASLVLSQSLKKNYQRLSDEDLRLSFTNLEILARENISLVESLLQWSKNSLGAASCESIDLGKMVSTVCDFLRPVSESHQVAIETHLDGSLQTTGDATVVTLILRNFLSNAIKASPAHSRVLLALKQTANGIEMSVSDRGKGIAPERIPTLFNLKKDKRAGIGLFLCKEFATYIGGSVDVESEVSEGSRFILRLPAKA